MSSTQELTQSTILCKHTHTQLQETGTHTHTHIYNANKDLYCLSGMFVRSLLGLCVCVALCVSQNADSEQHTPEQQDPIARKQPCKTCTQHKHTRMPIHSTHTHTH